MIPARVRDAAAKIAARAELVPSGCHRWTGGLNGAGRPIVRVGPQVLYAARVVLVVKLGRYLKRGMVAAHACDNPVCVNPDHLAEESYRDNLRAAYARCRRTKPSTLVA